HPQTVRQWDKTGVLEPHHKTPSGRRLYTENQVQEYFNKK
ncbi:MerR family transcriptional regulator, partial [bacterium]|nr:MerR family transcriptional regulator [bacterium]